VRIWDILMYRISISIEEAQEQVKNGSGKARRFGI